MSQADVDLRDEHCLYVKRSYATSLLMYSCMNYILKRIQPLVIKKCRDCRVYVRVS